MMCVVFMDDVVECMSYFFFFQAEDGIRELVRSRGLGDVYKRQNLQLQEKNITEPGEEELTVSLRKNFNELRQKVRVDALPALIPVSYTHLTLPTIYSV